MSILLLIMTTVVLQLVRVTNGGGDSSNNNNNNRYSSHQQVLSSIAMAMEEAVHDETPWIQKCKHIQEELEGLSKARRTALTSSEPTQHHYKTHFKVRRFLEDLNEMYYKDENRNPDDYYHLLRKTFPQLCAVQSLEPAEFGACFQVFVEVQLSKYKENGFQYLHDKDGGSDLGQFDLSDYQ